MLIFGPSDIPEVKGECSTTTASDAGFIDVCVRYQVPSDVSLVAKGEIKKLRRVVNIMCWIFLPVSDVRVFTREATFG